MAAMSSGVTLPARLRHQRRVQGAFDRARLQRRRQLGPRQIDLEEIVGHDKTAALVAVEQMMAAGEPEILHFLALLRNRHQVDLVGRLFLALDFEE